MSDSNTAEPFHRDDAISREDLDVALRDLEREDRRHRMDGYSLPWALVALVSVTSVPALLFVALLLYFSGVAGGSSLDRIFADDLIGSTSAFLGIALAARYVAEALLSARSAALLQREEMSYAREELRAARDGRFP